jgi:hypothetical protein
MYNDDILSCKLNYTAMPDAVSQTIVASKIVDSLPGDSYEFEQSYVNDLSCHTLTLKHRRLILSSSVYHGDVVFAQFEGDEERLEFDPKWSHKLTAAVFASFIDILNAHSRGSVRVKSQVLQSLAGLAYEGCPRRVSAWTTRTVNGGILNHACRSFHVMSPSDRRSHDEWMENDLD